MPLKSYIEQNKTNLDDVTTCIEPVISKFSSYGQKVILEAKRNGTLANFAKKIPPPKERKLLLAEGVFVKNSDIWARYVFREAYGINGKDLGLEWHNKFNRQLKHNTQCCDSVSCKNGGSHSFITDEQNLSSLDPMLRIALQGKDALQVAKEIRSYKEQNANAQVLYYKELLDSRPLNDDKFIKGCETLIWLFSNGHMNRKTFCVAFNELK